MLTIYCNSIFTLLVMLLRQLLLFMSEKSATKSEVFVVVLFSCFSFSVIPKPANIHGVFNLYLPV